MEEIAKIVTLQVARMTKRLLEKGIAVNLTPAMIQYLSLQGFDPVFGARPLKRLIQNTVLDELALQMVEGKIKEGDTVTVDYKKEKVTIEKK
jgi:ATP-dependent Clp protease ATP-binding subunit ClpB